MNSNPPVSVDWVLVTYRSAECLGRALASIRAEANRAGFRVRVSVIDHSESPEELEKLRALGPDRLLAQPNRGYAAGINAGVKLALGDAAREPDLLVVGNPDVELGDGALAALWAQAQNGTTVVGPQFELEGVLLPPADEQRPREERRRSRAKSGPKLSPTLLEREIRRCRAVWEAPEPIEQPVLSGALLAFAPEVFRRTGPWDEEYFLFFEETDWLLRARAAGMRSLQVPAARVRHAWGHADSPAKGAAFEASRARYYRSHFGLAGRWALRASKDTRLPAHPPLPAGPDRPTGDGVLWLVSNSPYGFPIGALEAEAGELEEVLRRFAAAAPPAPGGYTVFAAERSNSRLLGSWSWPVF